MAYLTEIDHPYELNALEDIIVNKIYALKVIFRHQKNINGELRCEI